MCILTCSSVISNVFVETYKEYMIFIFLFQKCSRVEKFQKNEPNKHQVKSEFRIVTTKSKGQNNWLEKKGKEKNNGIF